MHIYAYVKTGLFDIFTDFRHEEWSVPGNCGSSGSRGAKEPTQIETNFMSSFLLSQTQLSEID